MRGYDLVMAANQWGAPEIFEEPQQIFHFLGKPSLSMPFNVTGQPAMTVCCGFGSDGFPLAFQLAGRAVRRGQRLCRRRRLRTRDAVARATTPALIVRRTP